MESHLSFHCLKKQQFAPNAVDTVQDRQDGIVSWNFFQKNKEVKKQRGGFDNMKKKEPKNMSPFTPEEIKTICLLFFQTAMDGRTLPEVLNEQRQREQNMPTDGKK